MDCNIEDLEMKRDCSPMHEANWTTLLYMASFGVLKQTRKALFNNCSF